MAQELGEQFPGTIVTTVGARAAHLVHHLGRAGGAPGRPGP
ncbi:hypothetical protein [Wenjunlia tyrosinilytica]|nr:hypothetical protein [Wenjunlia tyrosinilytica]